jgi:hypothetical protein
MSLAQVLQIAEGLYQYGIAPAILVLLLWRVSCLEKKFDKLNNWFFNHVSKPR